MINLNRWLKFQNKISFDKNYDFSIAEIWRDAFKIAKTCWLKLLVADLIFIIVYTTPIWLLALGKYFPELNHLRFTPDLSQYSANLQMFFSISQWSWPFLYTLFVSFPVYLGMNLMSLRAAYQRPLSLNLLAHYINLYWWAIAVSFIFLIVFFTIPAVLFLILFYKKAMLTHAEAQFQLVAGAIMLGYLLIIPFLSMTINLIFAARQNVVEAFGTSWRAVKQHPLKICGMLLLWYLCQWAGRHTWFITDLFLLPPSYVAWSLLYKHIFGEKGLVE